MEKYFTSYVNCLSSRRQGKISLLRSVRSSRPLRYRYQHLGGNRYRLKELSTTFDGWPPAAWPLLTQDYDIELNGDRAIWYRSSAGPASDTFWVFLRELGSIGRMPRGGEEHWARLRPS